MRRKTCLKCNRGVQTSGLVLCTVHRAEARINRQKRLRRQKRLGLCVYGSCCEKPVKGHAKCVTHLIRTRLSVRKCLKSKPWRPGTGGLKPLILAGV